MGRPVTWAVLAGAAVLLAILGPFGTDERLRAPLRLVYWLAMVTATYGAGLAVSLVLWPLVQARLSRVAMVLALGLATGAAITPVITALNLIAFGYWPPLADWPALLAQFFAIAVIVTAVIQTLQGHLAQPAAAPERTAPVLLDRLPVDKRGPLLALSAEDHYTRIRTARGEELVLIRLSDAIAETAPTLGLQVHRSHWVAVAGVAAVRRQGDGAVITLRGGGELPVSRRYMPDIRTAGLLPA
jgi:DNA-binding LytR/AlgR family response regulator